MDPHRSDVLKAVDLSVVRCRVPVLRNINLSVSKGDVAAIIGPNGAGKSTMLACFAGILRPTSGEVQCFGNPRQHPAASKCEVGFVGHHSGLYAELSALENVRFAARMHRLKDPDERARRCSLTRDLILWCIVRSHTFPRDCDAGSISRAL